MKRLLMIMAIALIPGAVHAQDANVRAIFSIGASTGSYKAPIVSNGLAGSTEIGKTVLDWRARYSFARKDPGDGHNVNGLVALRIPTRKLFVGPAASFARQTTSLYSKTAGSVGAQIGRRERNVILSLTVLQDFVSVNKGRGYSTSFEWYSRKQSRVSPYFGASFDVQDFRCHERGHGPVDHCFSTGVTLTTGFIFRRG